MRNVVVVLIALVFFLSSCVGLATPAPTLVPTSTSTLLPSATPSPTLTPTATVDPNMPEGATGKDAQGNWLKTVAENGEETTYVYREIVPSDQNAPVYSGWFRLLTPKPIPLWDRNGFYTSDGNGGWRQ